MATFCLLIRVNARSHGRINAIWGVLSGSLKSEVTHIELTRDASCQIMSLTLGKMKMVMRIKDFKKWKNHAWIDNGSSQFPYALAGTDCGADNRRNWLRTDRATAGQRLSAPHPYACRRQVRARVRLSWTGAAFG